MPNPPTYGWPGGCLCADWPEPEEFEPIGADFFQDLGITWFDCPECGTTNEVIIDGRLTAESYFFCHRCKNEIYVDSVNGVSLLESYYPY